MKTKIETVDSIKTTFGLSQSEFDGIISDLKDADDMPQFGEFVSSNGMINTLKTTLLINYIKKLGYKEIIRHDERKGAVSISLDSAVVDVIRNQPLSLSLFVQQAAEKYIDTITTDEIMREYNEIKRQNICVIQTVSLSRELIAKVREKYLANRMMAKFYSVVIMRMVK